MRNAELFLLRKLIYEDRRTDSISYRKIQNNKQRCKHENENRVYTVVYVLRSLIPN